MRAGADPGAMDAIVARGMDAFKAGMDSMGFYLDSRGTSYVKSWFEFYYKWPGRRVVGFTEPEDIAVKLIADSFSVQLIEGLSEVKSAVDLGSGNGWPGLAVKLCFPEARVALMDARQGACRFMAGLLMEAPLKGTSVLEVRAEEAARDPLLREGFGLVASRAMAAPAVALELCAPFAQVGGKVVLWLGPEQEETVARAPSLPEIGLNLAGVLDYSLPSGTGRRLLAVYEKTSGVAEGFPRRYSNISKKPLF